MAIKHDRYSKILNNVLGKIRPDEKKIMPEVNRTIEKINNILKKEKIDASAAAGGSIAKGTFLKNDYDCDIFVRFDYFYDTGALSEMLGNALKKAFPPKNIEKLHGSRDYYFIPGKIGDEMINYEIIPVLDIYNPKDAKNTTDCSPLHVKWVNKFTKKDKKLKDNIRLTKAFCKSIGVYGAESYIKGFSGHVVDILTIYYGSFLKLLEAARKWEIGELIDATGTYKTRHMAVMDLNKSKTQSALIVIDPIQKGRNASAALGEEKLRIFAEKASAFLKKPGEEYFIKKEYDAECLKKEIVKKAAGMKASAVTAEVLAKIGKRDVVGAKIMKAFEFIRDGLSANEFKIHDSGWEWDKKNKGIIWFLADSKKLSDHYTRIGPSLKMKEHADNFKKAHKNTFEKGGRIYAKIIRKYREPAEFIESFKENEYIKEKIKSMSVRKL